tara:strand:+ start:305 stop:727 length:423 start_codon:yes stop_codon:yes gene_type:complete
MEIYDRGQNVRNWIYVKDHSAILYKILLKKNLIGEFNISTKYYYSNKILVKKIYDLLVAKKIKTNFKNFKGFVKFVKDRPAHDRKYNIDSTKINKKVKLAKFISKFDISLKQTIDWYIANKEFYKNKKLFLQRQGLIKKK